MSDLLGLPTEILREVFSHLTCDELAKVCLVSRRMHAIAECDLYRFVCLAPSSTQMFLSTILNRPGLARYVRHLRSSWDTISAAPVPGSRPLNAIDLGMAGSTAKSLGLQHPRSQLWHFTAVYQHAFIVQRQDMLDWPQASIDSFTTHYNLLVMNSPTGIMEWNHASPLLQVPEESLQLGPESLQLEAVQVVLLLHLLPNLRILESTLPQFTNTERSEFLDVFLEEQLSIPANNLSGGFHSLREIRGSVGPDTCRVTLKMLLAMLRMPSMRKIKVRMAAVETDPAEDIDHIFDANKRISSVTELDLDDCFMSATTLNKLLQVPRALTHLSFRDTGDFLGGSDSTLPCTAMSQVRETLQYLSLRISDRNIYDNREDDVPEDERPHSIGSLHDWPQLRTVKTSLLPLILQPKSRLGNALPAVIRELTLNGSQYWSCMQTVDEVIDVLNHKELYGVSDLSVINIKKWMVFGRRTYWLADACDAAGVQLRLLE